MADQGTVFRDGEASVTRIQGKASVANLPGVVCLNPKDPESERIYQKRFERAKIYLPGEYDQAVAAHLTGDNVLVIAMNGYTSLTLEKCAEYGVRPGDYEAACRNLLLDVTHELRAQFPGIDVRFVHGAGPGVDRVVHDVAAECFDGRELGFNCPEYLFYVEDIAQPIYVADNVAAYADAFVRSCDVLIAANGRKHSYKMDIAAVFEHGKHLVPVNVLRLISRTGGPPAMNARGDIEDAVAHYEQRVHLVGQQLGMTRASDPWSGVVRETGNVMVSIARQKLPPATAWTVPS